MKNITILLIFLMFVVICDVSATPYFPNENEVVFKIDKSKITSIKNYLVNDKQLNANEFAKKVHNLIEQARENNNPLMFGKIEALLIKNIKTVQKSDKLKISYADVLQQQHEFSNAIHKIDNINIPESNLLRSTIYFNLGKYKKSSKECKRLIGKIDLLVASTCLLHAESHQGNLLASFNALRKIKQKLESSGNRESIWTLTALADMSSRLGDNNTSLEYYQKALKFKPNNSHVMSEIVDVLFQDNRQDKIIKVLENNQADIRLKLRYFRSIILQNGLSDKHLPELIKLKNAISLLELREDKRHYDTRAEYYIWIDKNPTKAISWALKNWQVSKTPKSASLLIYAIQSEKNNILNIHKNLIREVGSWVKENIIEDTSLTNMIQKMIVDEVVA